MRDPYIRLALIYYTFLVNVLDQAINQSLCSLTHWTTIYAFSYTLAWHSMMPLFSPSNCTCTQTWDPLGLHASSCIHLNAYNLLHNSVRDCFAGAVRKCIATDPDARVSYILTDKHAKSATWMHEFYPLKPDAPTIIILNPKP